MAAVLGFVKTHLISLVSGIAIIACVVVATMGMSADTVVKDMQQEKSRIGADRIRSLRSDPKNEKIIAAQEAQNAKFTEEYDGFLKAVEDINARKPLMDGVFPKPEKTSTPLKFVEMYRARLEQLPRRLAAGTRPTVDDIAEEEQNVQDLLLLEAEQETETSVAGSGGRTPAAPSRGGTEANPWAGQSAGRGMRPGTAGGMRPGTAGGMRPGTAGGMRPGMAGGMRPGTAGGMRPGTAGGMRPGGSMAGGMRPGGMRPGGAMAGGMTGGGSQSAGVRAPTDEPKYNAVYRARVNKALGINCYVEDYLPGTRISPTFHVSPIINAESAPAEEDMWYAQMSMWVQEDVIQAIANLNKNAADATPEGDATVAGMPVKRIKSIEVQYYVLPKENLPLPGLRAARSGMTEGTFTTREANELYDVIRYQLVVIVDQRDMLKLVDEIGKVNFTQCVGMQYFAVDRNADEFGEGYFYGPDPVVEAVLDFEAYYLRSAYKDMMPDGIAELLGITK